MLVSAPGFPAGQRTRALTEFIDIYPSLCELAGLPIPDHVKGTSFVPLLRDPAQAWKSAAISRFGPGDTIRTDRYRFTEYTGGTNQAVARMLYDHARDPQENVNVAEQADYQADVASLNSEWRAKKGRATPRKQSQPQ